MTAFIVSSSGVNDQRSTNMAFDGLTFTALGAATVQMNATQFSPAEFTGSPLVFTGNAQINTVEVFVTSTSFTAAAVSFASWSADDSLILRDSLGNENITGSTQNDQFFISGGNDTVTGGGGSDLVTVDWSLIGGSFSMNGGAQFTNFAGTALSFSGGLRFNIVLGGGNDALTLGNGDDTLSGGGGSDTLNTGLGNAVVDGGIGTDLWQANFSDNPTAATVNINLTGTNSTGNGSSYAGIERLNLTGGAGNDVFISKIGNPNDGLSDTLSGGVGNDRLTVGGGLDVVDGGADNDTLVINWAGDLSSFASNGANQITDFVNTNVSYSNIERFDVTLGEGNDNVTTGANADTMNGGGGNDVLNTAAGAAKVDGGIGTDTWVADLSAQAGAKAIDLRLTGTQAAGSGTTYVNIEAMNMTTGAGNDLLITQVALLGDVLNGGDGNDTLGVGGGLDTVNGGLGTDDLMIVDYSTMSGSFSMNGAAQITNFSNTRVNFSGIERFDITMGGGNDTVTAGGGSDTMDGGNGDDTLNSAAGDADVTGGAGNDLWQADQSLDNRAKTIDLNLIGPQTASAGTVYEGIERIAITTGGGNDSILTRLGDGGNDVISTGDGDDTIGVGDGSDNVNGGLGTDLLIIDYATRSGSFSMNGASQITNFSNATVNFVGIESFDVTLGAGADNILLGNFADTVVGGAGNDVINTAIGQARVDGGLGLDTWIGNLSAAVADLTINLGLTTGMQAAGGGNFYGRLEAMNLIAGSGDDQLLTLRERYADNLASGAGNDILMVGGGIDVVDGGGDDDLLIIDYSTMNGSFFMNGAAQITNFSDASVAFTNIERFNVTTNGNNSTIVLRDGDDTITGGAGNDSFDTAIGAAAVDGGAGNDRWIADQSADAAAKTIDLNLLGVQVAGNGTTYASVEAIALLTGAGADRITTFAGVFADSVSTGAGNDTITVFGGLDTVNGGADDDLLIIDYSSRSGTFWMNGPNQITNFGDTRVDFQGIERIDATFGAGSDTIVLTGGDDTVAGGLGNDTLNGSAGRDTIDWRDATAAIVVKVGASGNGTVTAAGIGADQFTGFENFLLGSGDDVVTGGKAANLLDGGLGNDTLRGAANTDILLGGEGDDNLIGGFGRDSLTGGLGRDRLVGDGAADSFVFLSAAETGITQATRDVIADFVQGTDSIDLRALDAIAGGADDAFVYLGVAAAFTAAGEVRLEQDGANTVVWLNLDADPQSEASILLAGVLASTVTITDFQL